MQLEEFLDLSIFIWIGIIGLLSLYTLYYAIREINVYKFQIGFLLTVGINLIKIGLNVLYVYTTDYNSILPPRTIYILSDLVTNFQIYLCALMDLEVLKTFGVLNKNISGEKLKIGLIISTVMYVSLMLLPDVLDLFTSEVGVLTFSEIATNAAGLIAAVFDNIVAFYITILIYKFKNQNGGVSVRRVTKLISLNVFIMFLDWLAFGISIYSSLYKTSTDDAGGMFLSILVEDLIGIHSLCMVFVLKILRDVIISKSSTVYSAKKQISLINSILQIFNFQFMQDFQILLLVLLEIRVIDNHMLTSSFISGYIVCCFVPMLSNRAWIAEYLFYGHYIFNSIVLVYETSQFVYIAFQLPILAQLVYFLFAICGFIGLILDINLIMQSIKILLLFYIIDGINIKFDKPADIVPEIDPMNDEERFAATLTLN
ncbi:hypothetical protein HDV06_006677 [Boothiomyces sp. JEL0866]|nr:hypothetical protein HDV06_006677 [Boothiomyces sp. JEL0866]